MIPIWITVGACLGWLGGVVGIGGGLLAVPLLSFVLGQNQQLAQGTALVMVLPNVILGLIRYAQRGGLKLRLAVPLSAAAFPANFVGAYEATHIQSATLRAGFVVFAMALAAISASRGLMKGVVPTSNAPERSCLWAPGIGIFAGLLNGLFGVGGGVFAVSFMSIVYRLSQVTAQGFGLALVVPAAAVGLSTYSLYGKVDWVVGGSLAIGGTLTVARGVQKAHLLPDRTLRFTFAGLALITALALFLRY